MYNKSGGKISVMGEQVITNTEDKLYFLFGVVQQNGQWVLTMDGSTVMTLSDEIATGEEGIRIDLTVSTEDKYAQIEISPLFYNLVDYMEAAEAALAAIPEAASLTAENCTQYEDELEAYLAAAELFTDYEKTAHPVPEKITRLQELLAAAE